MMKIVPILVLKIVLIHSCCLGQDMIKFLKVNNLDEIKSESKTIFIDFYADWCAPCKKMEQEVFKDPIVADYYNTNFINYQINVDSEIGKVLKQKYDVTGFPTSLYLDKFGQIVARKVGYKDKDDFFNHGKSISKTMIETPKDLATIDEMYNFILTLDSSNLEDAELYNKFFNTVTDDLYKEGKYLDLLYSKVIHLDFENRGYKYLLNNINSFYQDSSRVSNYLLPSGMKGKHEIGWTISPNVNFISFVSIPASNANKKAKVQKDSALFESCIIAKESILKAVYGHVPNHTAVEYCKEYVMFYTNTVQDMDKAKGGMERLYGLLIENKTPRSVIQENERIKGEAKEKVLKKSPHLVLTHEHESTLNAHLLGYKNDVAFLLENFQRLDPSSPKIKQIQRFSKEL